MAELRMLHAGDRVRLRPGDRPRQYLFGRGLDEHGAALFTRGQTDITFAGRAFAVREDGERLVLLDDEDAELLAHVPGRKRRGRLGDQDLELPGKKPGRLGRAAALHERSGIVVAEVAAAVPPLPVLFALVVVVHRLGLAKPREQRPDFHVPARDSVGITHGVG